MPVALHSEEMDLVSDEIGECCKTTSTHIIPYAVILARGLPLIRSQDDGRCGSLRPTTTLLPLHASLRALKPAIDLSLYF